MPPHRSTRRNAATRITLPSMASLDLPMPFKRDRSLAMECPSAEELLRSRLRPAERPKSPALSVQPSGPPPLLASPSACAQHHVTYFPYTTRCPPFRPSSYRRQHIQLSPILRPFTANSNPSYMVSILHGIPSRFQPRQPLPHVYPPQGTSLIPSEAIQQASDLPRQCQSDGEAGRQIRPTHTTKSLLVTSLSSAHQYHKPRPGSLADIRARAGLSRRS
ncbi:hypothetical protein BD324DRAFT_368733 [Kockovaella imperatae]|uniref:Uncharacterized protein n=1 Tax=Kockovaella imperatae TaxID=4999 RepID=A0A1Y1UKS3_9TREE|nr:hypothetical protein BD324DRAFT_368733 [Kockovaella imperatae]ORX38589.1 hypothetical protein BD324DRAFT_368733 [Kockovaella imperatae]